MADDKVTDIRLRLRGATAAPDMLGDDGREPPAAALPPGCPVTPLGHQDGAMWFLDFAKQLRDVKSDCRKGDVMLLFGGDDFLVEHWPQLTKAQEKLVADGKATRRELASDWDQKLVQTALIKAASAAGVFSPQGKVFGRGAHRRRDDALVLHAGNGVLVCTAFEGKGGRREVQVSERRAGKIDGLIFPALPPLPAPAGVPSAASEAQRLLALFGRWYFERPDVSPLLLLGWVAQALICGAPGWRSHVWLTGETAAGKSTLQKVAREVLNEWAQYSEDASEAAIRQLLGNDTLAVLIDEAEADDRPERQQAMVNLARKASSAGKIVRGGADHRASEFRAQSAFLFSSILHAPLDPQDRNRFAILRMKKVPADAREPSLDLGYWREAGRRMHRRMVEQWPRFDRTLADYMEEIAAHGFEGRWRNTFGTLLACADMLLFDCAPSQESELNDEAPDGQAAWMIPFGREQAWVQLCRPLMEQGRAEAEDTTTRCIRHLTSTLLPAASGRHPEPVGKWLRKAMTRTGEMAELDREAREKLVSYGMRVVNLVPQGAGKPDRLIDALPEDRTYVAVAGRGNTPLRELFRGSKFYEGNWSEALMGAEWTPPGAADPVTAQRRRVRFAGNNEHAVLVPIEALIGQLDGAVEG